MVDFIISAGVALVKVAAVVLMLASCAAIYVVETKRLP
jgi:hypothetical protein